MATDLEHIIHPLASDSRDRRNSQNYCVDDWKYFESRKKNKLSNLMDNSKIIKESVEKTMQMQENTFRQQVKELHRLYSVQKKLMDDIKPAQSYRRPENGKHSQFQFIKQPAFGYNNFTQENQSSKSGSNYSGEIIRKTTRGFDLEKPAATAAADDQEEISTVYYRKLDRLTVVDECEVDLTLSIGGSSSRGSKK